jgi:hypothetical protein
MWYRVSGTRELKPQKLCNKNSDIARRDIPTRSEPFVVEDACKEILSSRRLGHWRTEREVLQYHEWRSGEKARAIHLRRTGGRDREISRTREFTG